MSDISGATLAEFNIPLRSSVMGIRSLQRILETADNPLAITRIKIQDNFVNANAQIATAKLKALGIGLLFHKDNETQSEVMEDAIMPLHIGGYTIYDSPLNRENYIELIDDYNDYLKSISIVESYPGEKQDIAWKHVFELKKNQNNEFLTDDVKQMVITITKSKHIQEMKNKKLITEEEADKLSASMNASEE